jgi:hypothetical protein
MKKQQSSICIFVLAVLLTCCRQALAQNAGPSAGSRAAKADGSSYVSGRIFDQKFQVSKAFYSSRSLMLKGRAVATGNAISPQAYQGIRITFAVNQQLEGKAYQVIADQDKMIDGGELKPKPSLDLYIIDGGSKDPYLNVLKNTAPYQMTLNFYRRQNGLLPGFIDLAIQGSPTKIKGYFWAAPE